MALDLHVLEGGRHGSPLWQIDDDRYRRLQPAFSLLRQRTGIDIDAYADTRFPGGLMPLIRALSL